jgi:hypothetical protein
MRFAFYTIVKFVYNLIFNNLFFTAILPNIVSLFKSPLVDSEFDELKPSISKVKLSGKNILKRNGKPQFESAMTWAVESSPLPECVTPNAKGVVFCDGSPQLKHREMDEDESLQKLREVFKKTEIDHFLVLIFNYH